jgi:dolichol kinase
MVSGSVVILEYIYLPPMWVVLLIIGGGILFYIFSRLNLLTSVNDVERQTYGQYVLSLGYLCTYIVSVSNPRVFIPAILIITFADSLAGLVGTLLKSKIRTWAGSITFFLVALGILIGYGDGLTYPWQGMYFFAPAIALGLTVLERKTPLGFDNLTVPVAAALFLLTF